MKQVQLLALALGSLFAYTASAQPFDPINRVWECRAVPRTGATHWGFSSNQKQARASALAKCNQSKEEGCSVVACRKVPMAQ